MRICLKIKLFKSLLTFILFYSVLNLNGTPLEREQRSSLNYLLPEVDSWKFSEAPQIYFPETLFEYINGAAEIYLSYDFKGLIVGQYKKDNFEAFLSIEIYDMGNDENSFGIYSAERFPDNKFLSVGNQGYLEDEALNFIAGKYYVKLLCFDCEQESESFLKLFSQEILNRIKDKGHLPSLLQAFPKEGRIPNSERFILRNFMGFGFLHNGYLADYKLEDLEFDCFIIEGESIKEAQSMLKQYLEARRFQNVEEISMGYRIQDRYYHNIYLARIKNYLCGVMKIKDGFEEVGERYLKALAHSLKK